MDKIRIRKEMAALVEGLRQYTGMLANGESISQAELADMLKKTADIHRNIVILDYLTNLKAAVDRGEMSPMKALDIREEKEPELIKRSAEQKPMEPKTEIKPEEVKAPELTKETVIPKVEPPVAEIITPPAPEVKKEESPLVEPAKSKQPDLFGGDLPPVVSESSKEKPKEKSKEKEKPKEDKSLVTKLQKKPIADLKSAIGINEKFQFINELFGGNMTEYNIAINQVNICNSREEAEAYLDTLRDLYKWKTDDETVIAFSELVERRFL